MDQSSCGRGGTQRVRAGSSRPRSSGHKRGAERALSHRRCGGHRGPRRHPYQLTRREAADAPTRLLPGRPTGSHLRGVQHVSASQRRSMSTQQTTQSGHSLCRRHDTEDDAGQANLCFCAEPCRYFCVLSNVIVAEL